MKPRQATTTLRIDREAADDILVNITASYTPAEGPDPDEGATVEDIKATIAINLCAHDGQPLYTIDDRIDLTQDEESKAEWKILDEA